VRIRKTDIYRKWYRKLADSQAKARIKVQVRRLSLGNAGDSRPIGEGLSELCIHYGPGYRVYYKDTGREIILLLCGGDKSTQTADIARAKQIAAMPREEDDEEADD
jgi:putative addiction module killer protein